MKNSELSLKQKFYSNGKLLLTGEYVVLDGAKALAIPTSYGQSLNVDLMEGSKILWESLDENGKVWFESEIELTTNEILYSVQNDSETAKQILQILNSAKQLNSNFLKQQKGFKITTKLDFPRNWGLGSSSTLINNIAKWAKVDAYILLEKTFGGSGYDIATAQHNKPISYSNLNNKILVKEIDLPWDFTNQLFFIHLNKKQNSREGIALYQSQKENYPLALTEISEFTSKIINCNDLQEFESLINKHEEIISSIINLIPVKELMFNDYNGAIKSLGAWGGDFILATGESENMEYFRKKGYETIIPFKDMLK